MQRYYRRWQQQHGQVEVVSYISLPRGPLQRRRVRFGIFRLRCPDLHFLFELPSVLEFKSAASRHGQMIRENSSLHDEGHFFKNVSGFSPSPPFQHSPSFILGHRPQQHKNSRK